MKLPSASAIIRLFTPGMFVTLGFARVTERTLFLSTYSDDFSCSNIVYARIDNDVCTDTSVCAILNDTDGSFHDSEMTACILDRDEFLKSAFKGSPYFTVELYPTDCLGKSYNTRSFVADGNCHPYAHSHFKVIQVNNTISIMSAEAGCDATDWHKEWSVDSTTQLNTEACVTDGTTAWKAYFVKGTTVADDSSSNPSATVVAPVSITPSPTVATTAPSANSSTTYSSLATPVSASSATALLFGMALSAAIMVF
ncbi:hypothetical protein F441_16734 [Phytophthora nicotianae CJ01A1]|uniref:Uncharacterized protein n=4 Tax=Phytophthora nicotianae TaxID=4792 RepID=V9ED74_PHYNI|nr:hypothetical protein F443_16891 [Phytophthora nicotianae P1569]ETK77310.1 hypothetical protein L915_16424 [Phytophthora nicotianae]ETP06941.1 hypothetical protein F441_16734 [Phytophthora nicotianae CJ01A1]ETP35036.1 hypothetical protein F442_16727 [Phytophthora nicotianae P10297]ETL30756.1 hypothetical protein L916_16319 [Phytophthora nicotianae]